MDRIPTPPSQVPPQPQTPPASPVPSPAAQTPPPQPPQTSQTPPPTAQYHSYQAGPQPAYQPVPSPYYVPAPQPKRRGWIVALVFVLGLFVFTAWGMQSCTRLLESPVLGSGSSYASLSEEAVGVITIDGTIQYDGSTSSPEGLKAQLDRAEADPLIKAVVLRVNSGGGTATAGEEMAEYVKSFSKPVVVSSASINASAAYMISSQADYIYTAKTTAIGSIGTILQITDLSGLYEKLGIRIDNITSSDMKDAGAGTRAMTEEERAIYQDMVNQINDAFLAIVSEGRSMDLAKVRELATGTTFTGMDAVDNGLADEIGTLQAACAKAASLAGMADSFETINLRPEGSGALDLLDLLGILGYTAGGEATDTAALEALKELEDDSVIAE